MNIVKINQNINERLKNVCNLYKLKQVKMENCLYIINVYLQQL